MSVVVGNDFFRAVSSIPHHIKSRLREFHVAFKANPWKPELRLQQIYGARNCPFYSARVDESYVVIILRLVTTSSWAFVWLGPNEEAFAWARGHEYSVDKKTGMFSIFRAGEQASSLLGKAKEARVRKAEASATRVSKPRAASAKTTASATTPAPTPAVVAGATTAGAVAGAVVAGVAGVVAGDNAPQATGEPVKEGLFAAYSDATLMRVGVPGYKLKLVRGVATLDEFEAIRSCLPECAAESLAFLGAGEPLEDVLVFAEEYAPICDDAESVTAEDERALDGASVADSGVVGDASIAGSGIVGDASGASVADSGSVGEQIGEPAVEDLAEPPVPTDDELARAFITPSTMANFVPMDTMADLDRVLDASLDTWRVFLHPLQRTLVEKRYNGPARILGGAGTGKTVVAMHRARRLAKQLQPGERVLFTFFNSNLVSDVQQNLAKICSEEELERIEVTNIDSWVARYLKSSQLGLRIEYNEDVLKSFWQEAMRQAPTAQRPLEFYMDEWNQVVVALDEYTEEGYLAAVRPRRGVRLNRRMRIEVWPVFAKYLKIVQESGVADREYAMQACCRRLQEAATSVPLYRHIVVDEAQDLSSGCFRLFRAMAGSEKPNDIFIVGDTHQRIYNHRVVLSDCGVRVIGRSSNLYFNYRTTDEIRQYAISLLTNVKFDDLDGGKEGGRMCTSLSHGPRPYTQSFATQAQECHFIAGEIKRLVGEGLEPSSICVVLRKRQMVMSCIEYLRREGLEVSPIGDGKDSQAVGAPGVRVATMNRVKGLEFACMFVAGVSDSAMLSAASRKGDDPARLEKETAAVKCLLYVAVTRAKKYAYVTNYGTRSRLLPAE